MSGQVRVRDQLPFLNIRVRMLTETRSSIVLQVVLGTEDSNARLGQARVLITQSSGLGQHLDGLGMVVRVGETCLVDEVAHEGAALLCLVLHLRGEQLLELAVLASLDHLLLVVERL